MSVAACFLFSRTGSNISNPCARMEILTELYPRNRKVKFKNVPNTKKSFVPVVLDTKYKTPAAKYQILYTATTV